MTVDPMSGLHCALHVRTCNLEFPCYSLVSSTGIRFSRDTSVLNQDLAHALRGRREPSEKIGTCVKSLQRERERGELLRAVAELMRLAPCGGLAAAAARVRSRRSSPRPRSQQRWRARARARSHQLGAARHLIGFRKKRRGFYGE